MRVPERLPALSLCLLLTVASQAQELSQSPSPGHGAAPHQPAPVGGNPLAVIPPGNASPPLSLGQKLSIIPRRVFSPQAFGSRLFLAGIQHWRDDPTEWGQGMAGFGPRLASNYGYLIVRNSFQAAADVAFRTDPRYDQCTCRGFWNRTAHAWRRIILARRDSGGEILNFSQLAGGLAASYVAASWLPDRLNTTSENLRRTAIYYAGRGGGNMLREFYPEIRRLIRRKR